MKSITIKGNTVYGADRRVFICKDNSTKKQFVSKCKESMIGYDSLRVIDSTGWK